MAVRADVHVEQPDLAILDARIAVAQVDAAFANRLDLGAEQRDPDLPCLEDVIVVTRLAVFCDYPMRPFALGLLGHMGIVPDRVILRPWHSPSRSHRPIRLSATCRAMPV